MQVLRPQCSHCIYWVTAEARESSTAGNCHRFPPNIYVNPQSGTVIQKFPSTDHRHWCGEWSNDESILKDMLARTTAKTAAPLAPQSGD